MGETIPQRLTDHVAITGTGLVTPVGAGVDPFIDALMEGHDLLGTLEQPWAAAPHELGAPVRQLDARDWVPPRRLRRMNRLSRMAVIASMQALRQARMPDGASTGVVLGTGLGALEDTIGFMEQVGGEEPSLANPALFPSTVMNVAASQVSIELGLQGYNTTVNHKEVSAEMALLLAVDALRIGRADGLLCGGVDELTRPVHHGYRRLGGLSRGRPRPYCVDRDGVALGEGAAVVMLEPVGRVRGSGREPIAEVAGAGAAGGERPLVAWGPGPEQGRRVGPAVEAGVEAVLGALGQARVGPDAVDLVVGPGCGSRDLDLLDATVLQRVFGGRPVPVTSPHGAAGTWMASGAMRLVCAVEMLRRQEILPTVAGECERYLVPGLVTRRRGAGLRVVLVCGHATGGASAALVLVR